MCASVSVCMYPYIYVCMYACIKKKKLLGNPPKITDEPITRIISKQLDIKLGPFTKEERDSVLRRIKNR